MIDRAKLLAFRRLVIGFSDGSGSAAGLEVAASFARLLESELLGVFVEDTELLEWCAAPLTRQVRVAGHGLTVVTPERLAEELAAAAAMARQRLSRVAAELGLHAGFQVERSYAASLEFAGADRSDLRVVVEPTDPRARYSYPFTAMLRGALRSAAPVLYVPHRARRRRGPVVAVERELEGPVHRLAAEIAAKIGERLVTLHVAEPGLRAEPGNVPATGVISAVAATDIAAALGSTKEHLLVVARDVLPTSEPSHYASIAAEREVSILLSGDPPPPESLPR